MLLDQLKSICTTVPEAVAVVADRESLTYAELETRATQLANHLVACGVARNSLVAVYMSRTVDVVVSLLGVMKSGAAYTVVEDDGQHAENCNRLLAINADLVICEPGQRPALHQRGMRTATLIEARVAGSGAAALPAIAVDDVAYVLFTSGSTGKPKGVSVSHGNIAHYTSAIGAALAVDAPLRYAHVSTLAADLGNTSLLLSLATGGCLHLINAQLRKDPAALRDYLIGHDIEFIKITPTHWNAISGSLGEHGMAGLRLRYLVLGGEALTVAFARQIMQSNTVQVLANHYGPTEATVGVTTYPIRTLAQLDEIRSECVPIGRPLGDTVLCVRDDTGAFASRSGRGELHIGGPSVALGYRNDEEATRAAFITLDSVGSATGRFYRTGDHVSIDEDGVVLFLGRVDRQVKVNGYRVELEHIENVLRAVPGVEEGAVYYLEAFGKHRLVAAMLTRSDDVGAEAVKRQLEDLLPDYMVPKVFVPLPAFPRNANGKVDMKALQAELVLELQRATEKSASNAGDPPAAGLVEEIRNLWGQYLHGLSFADDESFFDVGGDSLDAIQLIAELQLKGHQVTAHAFLNEPTVDGLVRAIASRAAQAHPRARRSVGEHSRHFSAAQDFFLRSQLDQADHYNQALLLECGKKVDIALMNKAVTRLLAGHPSLRTAYGHDDQGRYARVVADIPDDALEVTFIARESDEEAVCKRIETVSQSVQQSLSLVEGQVFKARLFKFEAKPDQLLLVAHHIAVDVISWRVLVSELSKLYGDFSAGLSSSLPDNDSTFLDWVEHVDQHQHLLDSNAEHWLPQAVARVSASPLDRDGSNTEGNAKTLWLGFTREETQWVNSESFASTGAHLHTLLLSLFAHALARHRNAPGLAIDVESHGRVTFGEDIDISRVVGWHTSTYPIFVDADGGDIAATISAVAAATHAITDLGMAYGVGLKRQPAALVKPSASICYNYLGNINFSHDDRLSLVPSTYSIGRGRGDDNHRGHALKLSGRIIDGCLVIDLSYSDSVTTEQMGDVLHQVRDELLRLSGLAPAGNATHLVLEQGTRTGLISYVPGELSRRLQAQRDSKNVLLTGATGYVGVHVLRELLSKSRAHIHCLVRGRSGSTAGQRLAEVYEFYFGHDDRADFSRRVTVLEGDVTHDGFGLPDAVYGQLASEIDAIYHFAADTRLFGREEDFRRNNVFSVQQCIDFCQADRPKQLHYMSTLAVCGVNARAEVVEFSERSSDVGQEFQNHYEATKYMAEQLVQEFRAAGGSGYIYRSGNVSGHSLTARFQRNARDNRFIQFLAACVKAGQLPRHLGEPLALSPIDEVAAGIVAISLDSHLSGGVFHVDSDHEVPIEQVFDALKGAGVEFEASDHATFAALFGDLCEAGDAKRRDPDLALGFFWATRKPRNVRFSNAQTLALLSRLGCSFSRLDQAWVARFIDVLVASGVFVAPRRNEERHAHQRAVPAQQLALS